MKTLPRLTLSAQALTAIVSLVFIAFYNAPLWELIVHTSYRSTLSSALFCLAFFVLIFAAFTLLLTFIAWPYMQKLAFIIIILGSASASYFMSSYGIVIDKTMIQNMAETDVGEVSDLLSVSLFLHLLLYGVLPALLVGFTRITYRPLWPELKQKLLVIVSSVLVLVLVLMPFYKNFSSLFRNHREIRTMVVPSNFIYYGLRYLGGAYDQSNRPVEVIGKDAVKGPLWHKQKKKAVTIFVVGETARAANFSLDGYGRNTNPLLSAEPGVINYPNVHSCGTSTAVSVPCMFSVQNRENYDADTVRHQQNVLDIIQRAGFSVLWRDNNSGCKGVCDRVEHQVSKKLARPEQCEKGVCFDEAMLNNLDSFIAKAKDGAVIVLHQMGSHGPAYSRRYPKRFEKFTPVCRGADLKTCSQSDIVNAYDNTILYTDYFLDSVIKYLKAHSDQYNSAMFYVSDHGESLGENNIYLHGLPYMFAPKEQKHVPFIAWVSKGYQKAFNVSASCLQKNSTKAISQDYVFHSLLGAMDVSTHLYNPTLDIFGTCRGK